jgi:uncharacterized protein with ParB-like and HNH nuclease domain
MINSAQKYAVTDIFSPDKDVTYAVPKYQREYAWSRDNWDAIIDDIIENPDGHFIGSIICINQSDNALEKQVLELVDGKQRLTTLSLLYAAIYKKLSEVAEDDEDARHELFNLKHRIILKSTKELKLELSIQNNNFNDYKTALDNAGVIEFSQKNQNWGNRIIAKAYRHYYENRLSDYNLSDLKKLLRSVNSALLVKIEVSNASDAFMLFESLNNRGVPLSAIDLVKNALLSKLDKQKNDIDEAFNKWNLIINNLPTEQDQERFLRQYYNGFRYDKKIQITGQAKATRSNLIKIYDELIKRDANKLFSELVEKSKIYNRIIVPDNEDDDFGIFYQELTDLLNVKAAPAYTFVLYLFSKYSDIDQTTKKEILSHLMKYFVRRNITDFPNTNDLDYIFIKLIALIEDEQSKPDAKLIRNYLTQSDNIATLDIFKAKLEGDIYLTNIDMARFVLSKIEQSKSGTREHSDLWLREKNRLVWTIEHIFPEGLNIPTDWVDMIANGDPEAAKKIQQLYVHKLGNLTLTGFNSTLSNMSFEKKRDRQKDGKDVGYKNGLFLNKELAKMNSWSTEDIQLRTANLVEQAISLFKYEDE